MNDINTLADQIMRLPKKQQTTLIGIDGCGGSGKSTLAKSLQALSPDITIVHMDDFFLPVNKRLPREIAAQHIGADFDWQRLRAQVLEPVHNDISGYYQCYDWKTDSMVEWHTVPVGNIVIVEGIYCTRKELAQFYDLKIWVECPRNLRLTRGLARDGEQARSIWEQDWMPAEDHYVESYKPADQADMIIDGSHNI